MAPFDYFDQKIVDMKFSYTWLDYIGQPNILIKKIEKSKVLLLQSDCICTKKEFDISVIMYS
jgi:hypothetical protein